MSSQLGWLDSYWGIMFPGMMTAFGTFLMKQFFETVPNDFIEAARVDGLNEFQIFLYIYLPTMRSTYAAAIIIVFMANWNNYLWPLIVLNKPEQKTATLVISALTSAYTPDFGMILFGTILATLPTLIIFFLLQRRFVEGMLGAVK
jgi:lactose/L-arabinose transport system permease protein